MTTITHDVENTNTIATIQEGIVVDVITLESDVWALAHPIKERGEPVYMYDYYGNVCGTYD